MKYLFITKPVNITREAEMLKIEGSTLKKIPVKLIDGVFAFGKVEFSIGARNLLLRSSKDIFLFDNNAKFTGVITNAKLKSNYKNRLLQYKNIQNLEIAKFFVLKKIESIEKFTKKSLNRYKEKLITLNKHEEILGLEGSVSKYMFDKIRDTLSKNGIEFTKREYRPATDMVNSLLSFSYSLFYGVLYPMLQDRGFDVFIGFLHKKRGTHFAFVSDVMEPYRVVLSAFVMQVLINKKITQEDFEKNYLNYEARKRFIGLFLELLENIDFNFIKETEQFIAEC